MVGRAFVTEIILAATLLLGLLVGRVVVVILLGPLIYLVGPRAKFGLLILLTVVAVYFVALWWVVGRYAPRLVERFQVAQAIRGASPTVGITAEAMNRVAVPVVVGPALLSIPLVVGAAVLGPGVGNLLSAVGLFLVYFTVAYHRLPNSRRAVKYLAYGLGSYLLVAGMYGRDHDISLFGLIACSVSAVASISVFMFFRVRLRPDAQPAAADPSTARAFRWYRWAMSFGPGPGLATFIWAAARLLPFVGDTFWAARICSKQRLAKAPVIFLRSFSSDASAELLGNCVAPAIGGTCVVSALVHPLQTSIRLHRATHSAWTATSIVVGDVQWQSWIVQQFRKATAVVVDATVLSENLRWEIDEALRVLTPSAVTILVPVERVAAFPRGNVLGYDPENLPRLANQLQTWIHRVVESRFGPIDRCDE